MKRINLYYTLFLFLFVLISNPALAQNALCNGSLGDPVVNIDFGRGATQYGGEITESNFFFMGAGRPEDGWYTIAKSTEGMFDTWHRTGNHTANDPNGYMMIVNASDAPSIFYEALVPDLCPNTTYEFAAWVINLFKPGGNKPNLTFTIATTGGTLLAEFNTGDIPESTVPTWLHPGFLFTTEAGITDIVIRIRNNGVGGYGNDIAVDDITFSPCGAKITSSIDGMESHQKNLCAGEDEIVTLSAEVTPGVYVNPQYLWQQMDANGIWQNMRAQTSDHFTETFDNVQAGTYKYQLLVAENGNINSANCRSKSPEFEVTIIPKPVPRVTPTIAVCVGERINLSVNEASSYSWSGPGFTSVERSPVIENATVDMSGTYVVKITNEMGCEATAEIAVTVLPPLVAAIEPATPICKGSSVSLNASGGPTYKWSPSIGLSAIDIANPVANPDFTTVYTVTVSNGLCENSASITVVVDDAFASAGPDKKILEGQRVVLQGTASDHVDFYWSPAEGLDDPYKLNPVASPSSDITYTLNAVSTLGCSIVDEMFIKVYKKLIVPNSFSPNGDGINDLWNITAIGVYPNANVKIVNRYGQLLFESSGYEKPWDGKYKNQDIPVGVYYYLINLNSELPPLSGSLMVIR